MSYFAAAVTRGEKGWSAVELDLAGVSDVEEVADKLRDVDPAAEVSLLLVESDDEYLAVLRLDEGEDLRVFGTDAAFAAETRLGAVLLDDVGPTGEAGDDETDDGTDDETDDASDDASDDAPPDDAPSHDGDLGEQADPDDAATVLEPLVEPVTEPASYSAPVGDADLLGDLGVPGRRLIALAALEGALPSEITTEICTVLGCADKVEELREV